MTCSLFFREGHIFVRGDFCQRTLTENMVLHELILWKSSSPLISTSISLTLNSTTSLSASHTEHRFPLYLYPLWPSLPKILFTIELSLTVPKTSLYKIHFIQYIFHYFLYPNLLQGQNPKNASPEVSLRYSHFERASLSKNVLSYLSFTYSKPSVSYTLFDLGTLRSGLFAPAEENVLQWRKNSKSWRVWTLGKVFESPSFSCWPFGFPRNCSENPKDLICQLRSGSQCLATSSQFGTQWSCHC